MKDTTSPQPNKGAGKHRESAADAKRFLPWLLLGGGALLLLLIAAAVGAYFLFRGSGPAPPETEKAIVEYLEKEYDAKHKLDDKGHVYRVELEGPHVDDEALDYVAKLKYLHELSLAKSSVTDEGIKKLAELKRLEHLGITETRVSDQGLKYLEKMPSLRWMWVVTNERLTPQGVEALKRALPGITVYVMNSPQK